MRKLLGGLYRLSGGLAGAFLVAICVIVTAQVIGNLIDRILIWTVGRPIGIIIPAYSNFAGFFLATSTFFALAYTMMSGEHIRVRLLLTRLSPHTRRWFELWCAGLGAIISATTTYFAAMLTLESRHFGDVVTGMVAIPLWIPQAPMVLGLAVLTIAMIDIFCTVLAGGRPPDVPDDAAVANAEASPAGRPPSDF